MPYPIHSYPLAISILQIYLAIYNMLSLTLYLQQTVFQVSFNTAQFYFLGINHSTQAAAAQREVTDMTNELLKKNAAVLKIATVETAKEAERSIVDIETLKQTNESLISTLDEVLRIQTEGREN